MALPFRVLITGNEGHSRWGYGGHPVLNGLFHAFTYRVFGKGSAVVINPVAYYRPAIVFSGLNDIEFISTARPMLMSPHFSGNRMPLHALLVTMSIGVYGFNGTILTYKGVVCRDGSIIINSIHFPPIYAQALWINISVASVSNGKIKRAVRSKFYAATIMYSSG